MDTKWLRFATLESNRTLTSLSVANNNITNEGAVPLYSLLAKDPPESAIVRLDITVNRLTEDLRRVFVELHLETKGRLDILA